MWQKGIQKFDSVETIIHYCNDNNNNNHIMTKLISG